MNGRRRQLEGLSDRIMVVAADNQARQAADAERRPGAQIDSLVKLDSVVATELAKPVLQSFELTHE